MILNIYELSVWLKSEEDNALEKAFSLEFTSLSKALKAYKRYSDEFLRSGRQAKIHLLSLEYEV